MDGRDIKPESLDGRVARVNGRQKVAPKVKRGYPRDSKISEGGC